MGVGLSSLVFLLWSVEIQGKLLSRVEQGGDDVNMFVPQKDHFASGR